MTDAEKAVISYAMINQEFLEEALGELSPREFEHPLHQRIWEFASELNESGSSFDEISLQSIGAPREIVTLASTIGDMLPSENIARGSISLVSEMARRRMLKKAGDTLSEMSARQDVPVEAIVERLERSVADAVGGQIKGKSHGIETAIKGAISQIEKACKSGGGVTGIRSGFEELDEMLSGFQRGDLVIVAGRPSMGKTALAMQFARTALESGPVIVFSLEMSKEALAFRMLCSEGRVDSQKAKIGALSDSGWQGLATAAARLKELPLNIDDGACDTVSKMRAEARRVKASMGLDMVVIDYIQLMGGSKKSQSREREIADISRGLKLMAGELNVPVVALSQLNRSLESRQNRRPRLSDLRESGALEQDADVILFVYRGEVYGEDVNREGETEIIVGKQRNGPIGTIKATFQKKYTSFSGVR